MATERQVTTAIEITLEAVENFILAILRVEQDANDPGGRFFRPEYADARAALGEGLRALISAKAREVIVQNATPTPADRFHNPQPGDRECVVQPCDHPGCPEGRD